MKENRYDDPVFFEKYSQIDRSRKGLEGAGEWRELKALLPDFAGKEVLDLGCGYGLALPLCRWTGSPKSAGDGHFPENAGYRQGKDGLCQD